MFPPLLAPLLLATPPARADLPAPDRWLATGHVAVGIAPDGSFGNDSAGVGLLFDPDGPEGAFPLGGDVLDVGRTFEAWSLSATVDGAPWQRVQSAPYGDSDLVLSWEDVQDDGALTWIHGIGGDDTLLVDAWVVLPWGQAVVWTMLDLTAQADLSGLAIARVYDPDIDAWATGSNNTANSVGKGVGEGVVVASGAWDGRAWALAAADGVGGICAWCTLPDDVMAGDTASVGDQQLGVALPLGDLATGDSVRVLFAYGFGQSGDDASALAQAAAATEDLDGDGSDWWTDCDDLDGRRSPAEVERANGVDDDCDGEIDEVAGAEDTGDDRDDWDNPIPDDGGSTDGGSTDGGSTAQDDTTDGSSNSSANSKGCSSSPAGPGLLGLLVALALPWRRR